MVYARTAWVWRALSESSEFLDFSARILYNFGTLVESPPYSRNSRRELSVLPVASAKNFYQSSQNDYAKYLRNMFKWERRSFNDGNAGEHREGHATARKVCPNKQKKSSNLDTSPPIPCGDVTNGPWRFSMKVAGKGDMQRSQGAFLKQRGAVVHQLQVHYDGCSSRYGKGK